MDTYSSSFIMFYVYAICYCMFVFNHQTHKPHGCVEQPRCSCQPGDDLQYAVGSGCRRILERVCLFAHGLYEYLLLVAAGPHIPEASLRGLGGQVNMIESQRK